MILQLSTTTPWNTNYCTEEGQIIYKVTSGAPSIGPRLMKISRIVAPELGSSETLDDWAFRDVFKPLAEVAYNAILSSRIKYGEKDESVSKFFRQGDWGFYGRSKVFTGPDGKEYAWSLTARVPKLHVNGTNTPIAIFHRHRMGIIDDARPASLEIFAAGEHMVDLILVTFVYIEKLRRARERAAARNPWAGGGGL
ncbi:hypothetical protein CPB83DRAFT_854776 [Crepidotus variabilis]|uniref:DUF6593 domain-containing protein n=1 Tax=Crepidotus variabilis TaxID=179855 RepID=A0A9P6EG46_9AGAR|nr:hypothetical protein CPB83DRAFT_854776 [Crepidotus variabilis]